jgi:small subunit ribosomal protein S2
MTLALPETMTEIVFEATGILFGQKGQVSKDMKPFIREISSSGNPIFKSEVVLNRLDAAGKFIRECKNPVLYATDKRFENGIKSFHMETKVTTLQGRFYAGTLSNSQMRYYQDCDVLIVCDPTNGVPTKIGEPLKGDRRAMSEASDCGIPVIAICNSNATLADVDLAIPANNAGTKAIATVFYILAASILETTPKLPLEAFETIVEDERFESEETSE